MTVTKRKILVVGINYAPEHAGIGPYTSAAAEHLASLGHEVTVLAGVPHYPGWAVSPQHRWRLKTTEVRRAVTVHRLRHFVPRSQDVLRRALYELSFAVHVMLRGQSPRPDVVIAVVPGLFSAAVAARIARRRGARFIVWIQDSMSAAATQSGMSGGRHTSSAISRLEATVLKDADWVVVASDAFRRATDAAGVQPTRVLNVRNWTHIETSTKDRAVTRKEQGWKDDEVIVLHSGNMGLKQDLFRVVEAARLAQGSQPGLHFVLMGDGSQRQRIEQEAAGVENLSVVAPVDDADYCDVLAAADVLLINERQGVTDMSLPSKLTSYLSAGRPVLAAVEPEGGTAAEIHRSGGGVITSAQTAQAIVDAVHELTNDRSSADAMGLRGQEYAHHNLSADVSLARLARLVDDRVGERVAA